MPIEFAPPQSTNLQGFQIAPAQYTDPLQTLSQMGQLRNQNLQAQESQLGIQQKQMDVQSEQGFMKAYLQSNGDIDQAVKLAPQYGVLPKDIFAAQQLGLEQAQKRAALDKTKMEAHDMWRDQVHAAYQPMFGEKDPNKQASLAASIGQDLVTKGLVTPDKVFQYTDPRSAQLYEAGLNTDKWITNQAAQISAQARTQTADTAAQKFNLEKLGLTSDNEQKQRASTSSLLASATNPADYDAIRDKYISGGGQTTTFPASRQVFDQSSQWVPGMQALINRTGMTPEQRQQAMFTQVPKTEGELVQASTDPNRTPADRQAASAALEQMQQLPKTEAELSLLAVDPKASPESRAKANAALKRLDQSKLAASPQFNLTIPGLGSGGGAPGTPGKPSSMAQSVANYQTPYAQAAARLPPLAREALTSQIMALNPDFHAEYYNTFNSTEKDAVTGHIGTSANALNTMMGHLSVLKSASDALKSGNLPALNSIANVFGVQTGGDAVTTYRTIVHRLGPEVTKAYLAAGGSVGERGTNEEDFADTLSPQQRNSNIGISALLADSKIKALQDQYQRGTYGRGQQKLMSDEAEQARQTLSQLAPSSVRGGAAAPGGVRQIGVKDPRGTVHYFNSEKDAQTFESSVKKAGGTTSRQ